MKKIFDLLLILVAILIVVFVGLTILGVSVLGTKTDSKYLNNKTEIETIQNRVLYSYGLDTLKWEDYVLKRKVDLILRKKERDSTITFQLVDIKDTLDNYGFTHYIKYDKSISIIGIKHHIIHPKVYFNKDISDAEFDLYDAVDSPTDWNGPFLFNASYGILNINAWSAGRKIFILPNNYMDDVEKLLLDKNFNMN